MSIPIARVTPERDNECISTAGDMTKIKHFMDEIEKDDGLQLWVEPLGLTRDLREWCRVDHVFNHVGPPRELWLWFEKHPDGYDYFRGRYHEHLERSGLKPALKQLARASEQQNYTLLHQSSDPNDN